MRNFKVSSIIRDCLANARYEHQGENIVDKYDFYDYIVHIQA